MSGRTLVRGVALPFGMLVLAFAGLFAAGVLALDVDASQRALVAMWILAPVVGGIATSAERARERGLAALLLGFVVAASVAFELLTAAGTASTCGLEVGRNALFFVVGCLMAAALAGGGAGASLLTTAGLAHENRPAVAVAGGVGLNFVGSAAAYLLFYLLVACFRP